MARKPGRRRRRLLFVAALGGAVWYARSWRSPTERADPLDEMRPDLPTPAPALVVPRAAVAPTEPEPVPARPLPTTPATTVDTAPPANAPDDGAGDHAEIQALFTPAASTAESQSNGSVAAEETAPDAAAEAEPPSGPGTPSLPDGSPPGPDYTIKGNAGSMLFHPPTSPYFKRTKAEVWFRTAEEARAAGFTEWAPRKRATR